MRAKPRFPMTESRRILVVVFERYGCGSLLPWWTGFPRIEARSHRHLDTIEAFLPRQFRRARRLGLSQGIFPRFVSRRQTDSQCLNFPFVHLAYGLLATSPCRQVECLELV